MGPVLAVMLLMLCETLFLKNGRDFHILVLMMLSIVLVPSVTWHSRGWGGVRAGGGGPGHEILYRGSLVAAWAWSPSSWLLGRRFWSESCQLELQISISRISGENSNLSRHIQPSRAAITIITMDGCRICTHCGWLKLHVKQFCSRLKLCIEFSKKGNEE